MSIRHSKLTAFLSVVVLLAGCQENPSSHPVTQAHPVTQVAVVTTRTLNENPIGSHLNDFTLDDYLGAAHTLSDWKNKRAIVVVFLGTECPLAKLYGQRLVEMAAKYEPQGVQFVGINANRQDTLAEMAHYARLHNIDFPLLKDPDCRVADLFGATRTPEAFLLDEKQTIRYWGRIDDQYGVGYSRGKPTASELTTALEELLADKSVTVSKTTAVGCVISRPKSVKPHGDITYCHQISRIVQRHCIECHRDEQIAPFALATYDEVAAWADTMLEVIDEGRMPPWHANPEHGKFLNDARMPDEDKKQLAQWVENGLPEGDPADLPLPREFAAGWRIPEPDVVFKMPQAFDVPAKGVVSYKHFMFDPGFTEDKWVIASEARPGNRAVVHHLILFFIPPGQKNYRPEDALFNMVAAYAPGMPALSGPESLALRIPAGSKLCFQVHYTPNGSPQTDISEAGLIFTDAEKVEKEFLTEAALNFKFRIPPGAKDYRVKTSYQLQHDALIYSLTPHMHYRGKSFRFTAHYPDNSQEILLDVPRYDFNWQNVYLLAEPKRMPAGTQVQMVAHYDNSADNLLNPDSTATVYWGDQTWQEMMIGSITMSRAEQNLRLGPPRVEKIGEGKHLVHFCYRPTEPVESVYLAGSFNDWQQAKHRLDGPNKEGLYTTTLELDSGEYEYKFVLDGKTWKNDPGNSEVVGFYQNNVVRVE